MAKYKMIIDVCLFIDYRQRGANNPVSIKIGAPNWFTIPESYQNFEKLLKTGRDYEHFLIGTKLKTEFSNLCNGKSPNKKSKNNDEGIDRGLAFMKWYNACTESTDAIDVQFEIDPIKRIVKTNLEDKKFDEYVTEYINKRKEDIIKFKDKHLSKFPKDQKPANCKINDWHIISACAQGNIKQIHTTDEKLSFMLLPLLNEFHNELKQLPELFGRNNYMLKKEGL
ncbi:hypothetical protein JN01_0168 [Entomoplasma freundtii]|uniref:Uncharacterized protein n=1 Tax=Entomoplasma freundtii TaxID=74700 RepID=A0A2K8NST2_9MOLU|nr:hypothetical protein [Entomoplasma freundtii]ATZ16616.1 hypothetical protein EFREU_v1c05960 [Entomoplasma freundtii]TDY58217.1 hypothetical protein JN01_0168 [Entomoplasma freundtii]